MTINPALLATIVKYINAKFYRDLQCYAELMHAVTREVIANLRLNLFCCCNIRIGAT
jgi:hypothetical protein